MRRHSTARLCWWTAATALGGFCWLCAGLGLNAALGAPSLADPAPFLAQYGLTPAPFEYERASQAAIDEVSGEYAGAGNSGVYLRPRLLVLDELEGVEAAAVTLHEAGHAVSDATRDRDLIDCDADPVRCSREWETVYEEGPVESFTRDKLRNYWHWLTGKRLRAEVAFRVGAPGYDAPVALWRRASVLATGQPRRSRAAQEWRAALLTISPLEREQLLASVSGP